MKRRNIGVSELMLASVSRDQVKGLFTDKRGIKVDFLFLIPNFGGSVCFVQLDVSAGWISLHWAALYSSSAMFSAHPSAATLNCNKLAL